MQLGSDCEGNQIAEAALGPARGERMPPDRKPQRALVANRGWKRSFEDPIPLLRGRQLVTLEDAGNYITKLPRAEHEAAEWQAAMEALILVPVANQIRTYWWCSPPRTGRQRMLPARSTARETGASFSKDRCVRASL